MSSGGEDQNNNTTLLQGSRLLYITQDGNQSVGINSFLDPSTNAVMGLVIFNELNDPPNQTRISINNEGITETFANGDPSINVSWENFYLLKEATPALRIPDASNIYVVNNTYEANDNNLAKTRKATLSAVSATDPTLALEILTTGEKATLTQDTLTYLDMSGGTPVSASWASIIAGNPTPSLSGVLAVGNSAGTFDIDMSGNDILNCASITSIGDLLLNPVGSIDANGKTLNMTAGEIHNCPLIHSQNNTDITIEGKGTGDVILKTANTNRLGISDTGDWTINGGVGTSGQVLTSAGAGVSPSWTTPSSSASSLSATLAVGNSAGTFDIDMSGNELLNVDKISVASPFNFSVIGLYDTTTARNTAIPSPYSNQFAWIKSFGQLTFWNSNIPQWLNYGQPTNLSTLSVSGFTLGVDYSIIYVDSSNTVVGGATETGSTIYKFNPTTTTAGSVSITKNIPITYLLVGGGGGGGGAQQFNTIQTTGGGGGGAGGYKTGTNNFLGGVSYAIQVGGGGSAGINDTNGTNGGATIINYASGNNNVLGGGYGGSRFQNGNTGGSGGGGGGGRVAVVQSGGLGFVGEGNNGGNTTFSPDANGGGGGGASAVGGTSGTAGLAVGGAGTSNTIAGGSAIFYSGGGGAGGSGAGFVANAGGNGGGGGGGASGRNGVAGTNGTGGGGGGAGINGGVNGTGGVGGSGLLLIRFPTYW